MQTLVRATSAPTTQRLAQFYSCGKKAVLLFAAIDLLLRAVLKGRSDAQGQPQPLDGKGSKVRAPG
jgi:hypothetical protein